MGRLRSLRTVFIAAALTSLETKHSKQIDWHFFANSHGKGVVDGIGGSVKRFVWSKVKSRKNIVTNAHNFAKAAGDSKFSIHHMMEEEIAFRREPFQEVFSNAQTISCMAKVHYMAVDEGKPVTSFTASDIKDYIIAVFQHQRW